MTGEEKGIDTAPHVRSALTPPPGSPEELQAFDRLQQAFPEMYRRIFLDPQQPRTVVVVPSMSLDIRELAKIDGVLHYEERLLCLLMLLRMPRTQLVYVTSLPMDPTVIDYYLHLLPGIPAAHARDRLDLIHCDDPSLTPLSEKILARQEILDSLRRSIRHPAAAHLTCFNSTALERTLAVQLGMPMYAVNPALSDLGNKTMSRAVLREAGLTVPDGFEDLRDVDDLANALIAIHQRNPSLENVVVKLNDGFSGEGNAIVPVAGLSVAANALAEARNRIWVTMRCVAPSETPEQFLGQMETMGGIAEAMIESSKTRSPSVQMRIDPLGNVNLVSTHDQLLSGAHGQVFEGCTFPARPAYRLDLHDAGYRVGAILRDRGVIGRFGVDFVSAREQGRWLHHAIEINLRKGGTTFPYLMLEFLTDGTYDPETGVFRTPTGDARTYYATDNLMSSDYAGLTPAELIDVAIVNNLLYRAPAQEGMVFHLLGAVTDHGKIGMVSIAKNRRTAIQRYSSAVSALARALT